MKLERFRLEISIRNIYQVLNLKDPSECFKTAVIVQFLDFPDIVIYPLGPVSRNADVSETRDISYRVSHKADFVLEYGLGCCVFPTQCFCTLAEFMTNEKARTVGRWTTVCGCHGSPTSLPSSAFPSSSSFQTVAIRNRHGDRVGWAEMSSRVTQITASSSSSAPPSPMTSVGREHHGRRGGWEEEEEALMKSMPWRIDSSAMSNSHTVAPTAPFMIVDGDSSIMPRTSPVGCHGDGMRDAPILPSQQQANQSGPHQPEEGGGRTQQKKRKGKEVGCQSFRLVVKPSPVSQVSASSPSCVSTRVETSVSDPPVLSSSLRVKGDALQTSSPSPGPVAVPEAVPLSIPSPSEKAAPLLSTVSDTILPAAVCPMVPLPPAPADRGPLSTATSPVPAVASPPVVCVPPLPFTGHEGTSTAVLVSHPPLSPSTPSTSMSLPSSVITTSLSPGLGEKNFLSLLQFDILFQLHGICDTIITALKNEVNGTMCTEPAPETPETTIVLLLHSIDKVVSQLIRKINIVVQVVYRLLTYLEAQNIRDPTNSENKTSKPVSVHADATTALRATGAVNPLGKGDGGRPTLGAELFSPCKGSIGAFLFYDVLCQLQGVEGHVLRLLEQYSIQLESPLSSVEPSVQTHCTEVDLLVQELMKQVNVLIQLGRSGCPVSTEENAKAKKDKKSKAKQKTIKGSPPAVKHRRRSSTSVDTSLSSSIPSSSSTHSSSSSRRTSLPAPPSSVANFSSTPATRSSVENRPFHSQGMVPSSLPFKKVPTQKRDQDSSSGLLKRSHRRSRSHSPKRSPTKKENKHSHHPHHKEKSFQKTKSHSSARKATLGITEREGSARPPLPSVPAPLPPSAPLPPAVASPATPSFDFSSNELRQQLESFTFGSSLSIPVASLEREVGGTPNHGDAPHQKRPSTSYSSDDDFTSSSSSASRKYSSGRRYSSSSSSRSSSSSDDVTLPRHIHYTSVTPSIPPPCPMVPGYPVQATPSLVSPIAGVGPPSVRVAPPFFSPGEAMRNTSSSAFIAPPVIPFFPSSELIVKEPPITPPHIPGNSMQTQPGRPSHESNSLNLYGVVPPEVPGLPSSPSLPSSAGQHLTVPPPFPMTSTLQSVSVGAFSRREQGCQIVGQRDI